MALRPGPEEGGGPCAWLLRAGVESLSLSWGREGVGPGQTPSTLIALEEFLYFLE